MIGDGIIGEEFPLASNFLEVHYEIIRVQSLLDEKIGIRPYNKAIKSKLNKIKDEFHQTMVDYFKVQEIKNLQEISEQLEDLKIELLDTELDAWKTKVEHEQKIINNKTDGLIERFGELELIHSIDEFNAKVESAYKLTREKQVELYKHLVDKSKSLGRDLEITNKRANTQILMKIGVPITAIFVAIAGAITYQLTNSIEYVILTIVLAFLVVGITFSILRGKIGGEMIITATSVIVIIILLSYIAGIFENSELVDYIGPIIGAVMGVISVFLSSYTFRKITD